MKADDRNRSKSNRNADDFQREADRAPAGLISEFVDFVLHNKKWWMIPIVIVLLVLGLIVALQASGIGWALYTVF
jgi:hypothetical protein